MTSHRQLRDVQSRVSHPTRQAAPVLRIAYDEAHYADAEAAVAGIRDRMQQGSRVVVIRGPAGGPFAVVYQRELSRES